SPHPSYAHLPDRWTADRGSATPRPLSRRTRPLSRLRLRSGVTATSDPALVEPTLDQVAKRGELLRVPLRQHLHQGRRNRSLPERENPFDHPSRFPLAELLLGQH